MSYFKRKEGGIEETYKKLSDDYQQMFKKELEKAGKSLGSMNDREKKDFFNKIDKKYNAKNEADLSKSTIKKVHKMADELPKKDFKDRYGKEKGDSVRYATATNMIKKKMGMKEDLGKEDEKSVKDVVKGLKKATQLHSKQADSLSKALKNEEADKEDMPKKEKKEGNKQATIDTLKDKINILQTKLENEKNKAVKPEPNPETGEVPLTVGVAYKHLRDKMKKRTMERFEVNEEDKNNYDAESGIKQKQIAKGTPKKTDTGEKSTPVVMNPKVDYKY
tara:strand:- start:3775 stop:4605 length:831 start_codon:yes stop_codon:yes gene_type:complete